MKRTMAIYNKTNIVVREGKFAQEVCKIEVRVIAIAEGYAMVRRKRAMPFVCSVKELELNEEVSDNIC